jgi:hypothetical protein
MNKTLKNIVFGLTVAGALFAVGCRKDVSQNDISTTTQIPSTEHYVRPMPSDVMTGWHLNKTGERYSIMLTGNDSNGNPHCEVTTTIGLSPGSYSQKIVVEEGYFTKTDSNKFTLGNIIIEIKDSEYFERYKNN